MSENIFTLTVTGAEVHAIGEGLNELKYSVALPIISKLQQQVNEQLLAAQENLVEKEVTPIKKASKNK